MSDLETRLHRATDELRADVSHIDPPPFEPASRAAPMLAAAVLAIAIGVFAVFAMLNGDDRASDTIVTTPDTEEQEVVEPDELDVDEVDDPVEGEPASTEDPLNKPAPAEATPEPAPSGMPVAAGEQVTGPISTAIAGETTTPVDGVAAWNVDESLMLLYRRTDEGSRHVVIDASTGDDVAVLDIDPPDIEQVYWSPDQSSVLYYVEGADLVANDLATGQVSLLHTFAGCSRVTAGPAPVAPSSNLDFGFLCIDADDGFEYVAFNVKTKREVRTSASTGEAPRPSPSGEYYVAWNEDGSASVLDPDLEETGVVLGLYDNAFVFVRDGQGREAVAAAVYDGPAVGTVVVLPLDGSAPQVIIGPDAGDEYPPSGTRLSAVGSRLAVSVAGPESLDSALAGRLLAIDLAAPSGDEVRVVGSHGSVGTIDHWSTAFVSISPTGRFLATSSDNGGNAINTRVVAIPG